MTQQQLICICGSAGSIKTIHEILRKLRPDFKTPIIILVHTNNQGFEGLKNVFSLLTSHSVQSPMNFELIKPSKIYIVPPLYHTQVERDFTFSFSVDAPVNYSRPSIDVLLHTASIAFKEFLTAIILSGASKDGSYGAKKVEENGGTVIIQSPEGTKYKTMLTAAINKTTNATILPISEIIQHINSSHFE